jgi:hypothetical protein
LAFQPCYYMKLSVLATTVWASHYCEFFLLLYFFNVSRILGKRASRTE